MDLEILIFELDVYFVGILNFSLAWKYWRTQIWIILIY